MKIKPLFAALGLLALLLGLWRLSDRGGSRTAPASPAPMALPEKAVAPPPREPPAPPSPRDASPAQGARAPTVTVLPEKVRDYLAGRVMQLRRDESPSLGGPALEELLGQFEACRDPHQAARLARVLCRTVDERVVSAFTRKLTNGFAGMRLSKEAMFEVAGIAAMLADNASTLDSAFTFLLAGTTTAFWDRTRKWTVPEMEEYASELMARMCWRALGISRRPEAYQYLLEFRSGQRVLEHLRMASAVDSAAFHYLEGERLRGVVDPHRLMDIYREWTQTEEGRKWDAWSDWCREQEKLRLQKSAELSPSRRPGE